MLGVVGLAAVADERAGKFSLGMSQRLGIAATLLGDPEVMLFDEPVNGLDPDGIRWVRNLLKGLAREGRTVFVSSHLMSEMALTADEVVIIGRGRLIAQIPIDELLAQSSLRYVRVRSPETTKLKTHPRGQGSRLRYSRRMARSRCEAWTRWRSASSPPPSPLSCTSSPHSRPRSKRRSWSSPTGSIEYRGELTTGPVCHGGCQVSTTALGATGPVESPATGSLRDTRPVAVRVDEASLTALDNVDSRRHGRARYRDFSALATAETRAHWSSTQVSGFDPTRRAL